MSPAGDQRLEALRCGDPAALQSLFEEYYGGLRAFARSLLHDLDAAEDVVQTVFLRLWQGREHLAIDSGIRLYLYQAVRNQALNVRRGEAREAARRVAADQERALAGGLAPAGSEDDLDRLYRAIAELPPRCREALELQAWHDLTYAEIAGVMGVAPGTVKTQIGQALKRLRVLLGTRRSQGRTP